MAVPYVLQEVQEVHQIEAVVLVSCRPLESLAVEGVEEDQDEQHLTMLLVYLT